MAKNSIRDFSATAGSNTDIQSVNIDENCPASGINNAIRELMVDLKNVSTGAVNLETPAADSLTVAGDLTVDTNTLKVDSSNNRVGIGTTAPSAAMHIISGSDNANTLLLADTTTNNTIVDGFVTSRHANSAEEPVLMIQGRSTGSANEVLIGGTHNNTTYNTATSVKFYTASSDTSTTPSERMVITSGGNVGIGTASPVSNSGFGGLTLNGDNGAIFSLKDSDTEVARVVGSATEMSFQYGTSSALTFKDGLSGGQERLRLDSSGRLLMGVTGPTNGGESFYVDAFDGFRLFCSRGSTALREQIVFHNPNGDVGSIDTDGSSTSYNTSSDHRLKENVADMTGAIDRVKQLAPKRFNFIADADTTVDGFLAHEAQAVVPEAVTGTHNEVDDDGNPVMQGIDQSKLVPLLTAALKESIAKIETLETEMTALKARVTALEA